MEVLGALASESIESLEILDGQAVEVAAPLDHAALQQLLQHLPAGALDVHPAATDEVRQLLGDPRRASRIRAVHADRALVLHDCRAAHRAGLRHREFAFRPGPLLDERAHDLGDHVAGLLQDDAVADADVLAPDLVEVVERRPGDGRTGHLGRREVGDRRERSRPPDVRDDVLDRALDLLGRELVGDRPARRAADHAQSLLLVEAVDLDDDAVGLVRQVVARLAPALGEGDDALDVEIGLVLRVLRQPEPADPVERVGLGSQGPVAFLQQLVRPEGEQPAGRDGRVLLAQRARARVARIGVQRQPGLLALAVDAHELGLRHEDLAANVGGHGLCQAIAG